MDIAVIGLGYVGLVTGTCLADLGNNVICVDKDKVKIDLLKKGSIPFYEPGLKELVAKNSIAGRLVFSINIYEAIKRSQLIFIAVGTPPKQNGEADLSAQIEVAHHIAKAIKRISPSKRKCKIIVNKSTVPVGMGDIISKILRENNVSEKNFSVVSNPEFLREGTAMTDFFSPDRIVIGASSNRAFNVIAELYRPLNAHIVFTSVKSAELIKYASNAFLATRISFINEMANICQRVGADISEVINGMRLDKRIGSRYLNPGIGYGGSCLPKDVSALIHLARNAGYTPQILRAVENVDDSQKRFFVEKVIEKIKNPKGKTVTVLGLSFKPGTDDLRKAPSLEIIKQFNAAGVKMKIFDPVAMPAAKRILSGSNYIFCSNAYEALKGSEAMIVVTEWNEFRELDLYRVRSLMKKPLICDGRNVYNPKKVKELGIHYVGIGC